MVLVQEKTQTVFVCLFFLSKALAWEGAAETISACEIRTVFKTEEVGGKEVLSVVPAGCEINPAFQNNENISFPFIQPGM